jgi:hypothetical protein
LSRLCEPTRNTDPRLINRSAKFFIPDKKASNKKQRRTPQTSVTVGRLFLIRFQIHPNLSRPLVALSSSPKEEEEERIDEDSAPVIFILVSRYYSIIICFSTTTIKDE